MTIDLTKHQENLQIVLTKKNIQDIVARVVLVLDISGSMYSLYKENTIQKVVNRIFTVAMKFDDNQTLDSYIFSSDFVRLPSVDINNYVDYVSDEILFKFKGRYKDYKGIYESELITKLNQLKETLNKKEKGNFLGFGKGSPEEIESIKTNISIYEQAFSKSRGINYDNRMEIFYENNEPVVMNDIVKRYTQEEPSQLPTFVVFISDGGIDKNEEIKKILKESSNQPIFWQFIGLGQSNYGALQELDELDGRVIDNANFFALDDIDQISDEELYDRLLTEFPEWIKEATRKNILRLT